MDDEMKRQRRRCVSFRARGIGSTGGKARPRPADPDGFFRILPVPIPGNDHHNILCGDVCMSSILRAAANEEY